MVIKRSRDYEDLDESNGPNNHPHLDSNCVIPQEIEMASVSVVPDGI